MIFILNLYNSVLMVLLISSKFKVSVSWISLVVISDVKVHEQNHQLNPLSSEDI